MERKRSLPVSVPEHCENPVRFVVKESPKLRLDFLTPPPPPSTSHPEVSTRPEFTEEQARRLVGILAESLAMTEGRNQKIVIQPKKGIFRRRLGL